MADCPVNKIDSNNSELAIAEEVCPGILPGEQGYPGAPVWRTLQPNSYSDFGSDITTIARNPINRSRQNQKGTVSDIEASGGFNHDFILNPMVRRLQEFFFADQRAKPTTAGLNSAQVPITAVSTADGYSIAGAAAIGFAAGQLILAEGFTSMANNGLKVVASATSALLKTSGAALVADAAPNLWASLSVVGFQFPAGDVAFQAPAGDLPRIVATATDLSLLGLIAGEWVFLGGDGAAFQFDGGNSGFARIKSISATTIVFDKINWAATAQSGAAKTIRIFFGDVIRNESDPALIKPRSVQIRRTLGDDEDGVQSEYLIGAFASELTVNMPMADKINMDLSYMAMDNVQRSGLQGLKPGITAPAEPGDAFNTTSDFARVKLAIVSPVNGNIKPLFSFATELGLTINNNITMNKAIGVFGAFSQSAGNFEVGGDITAYFSTQEAVQAVRNNADVTLDLISVKKNTGFLWDIPLLTLGGGRVTVEQDAPIMVPLENMAAESEFGHTLLFQSFKYLPTLAA